MGVTFNQLAAVRAYSSCSQAVRQTQWRPTTLLALSWSRPDRAKQNVASFWTTRRATATCVRPSVRLSSCPSVDRRLAAFIIPLYNICLAMNLIDVHSWPCGQLHCQTLAMQSPGAGREQRERERVEREREERVVEPRATARACETSINLILLNVDGVTKGVGPAFVVAVQSKTGHAC